MRFSRLKNRADIDEAIEIANQALILQTDDDYKAFMLDNLGNLLARRWEENWVLSDLQEALNASREASQFTLHEKTRQVTILYNLAGRLAYLYMWQEQKPHLEEGIEIAKHVVDLTPQNHRERATYLCLLGNLLRFRYAKTGMADDIQQAIAGFTEASGLVLADDRRRPNLLHGLGACFGSKYERTEELEDLNHAILLLRDAVKLKPENPRELALSCVTLEVISTNATKGQETYRTFVRPSIFYVKLFVPLQTATLTNLPCRIILRFKSRHDMNVSERILT